MAIAFVLMVGALSGGLVSLATSGLANRNSLQGIRDQQYAADGAIEQAIAEVRFLTCATKNGVVPATSVATSMNRIPVRVEWATTCSVLQSSVDGRIVAQRNATFTACAVATTTAPCSAGVVIIRAVVNFEQAAPGAVTKTYVQSWSVNR